MLRKIVVILTMLLCSMATQLYALGLGAVTVESSLNQPLRMRVELLQLGDTQLEDIRVSMASNDDFERFNIERNGFLSNIRFSVESTAQGNVVILTTSQIVREPYLSFILDTRWPNGRLLSEHTVLLDLPVFDDQRSTAEVRQPISPVLRPPVSGQAADAEPFVDSTPAPAVSAPSSTSSTNSAANLQPEIISDEPQVEAVEDEPVAPEPVTTEVAVEEEPEVEEPVAEDTAIEEVASAPEPEEESVEEPIEEENEALQATADPIEPEAAEPETIETGSNDTLSDIALQVRPNPTVTMQQTMLAIQEANPDAFADGNINRLRSGQVLRVPSLEDIQAIDPRDAVDEVTRQNQEFADLDVQPLAAPSTATPGQDDQPQGQLSVVSSEDAIDASGGAAELAEAENDALDQRIAELESQLAQRQEEVDRARIEREELDSRMADLEEQIAAAQEIIRLQDIQLAQLQESLAAAAEEAEQLAAQQAIQAAAEAEAAQPVTAPTTLLDDVLRILTGNSIFMISGVVLAILLLVVLMLRRNRATKTEEHDIDEIAEQDFDGEVEASTEDTEKDEAASEFQDYDSSDLDSELDDIIGVSDESEGTTEAEEVSETDESDEAPQLDVLTIADQLIGEQQYRRALSMLNTSLQEQGENDEVRAKIADVETLIATEDLSEQNEIAEDTSEETSNRESETKSFLDDLGIDLDSFDYDEESGEEVAEEAPSEPIEEAAVDTEEDSSPSAETEDVDMMFDLGGDDEVSEDAEDAADSVEELAEDAAEDTEAFEFDLDDDSNEVESEAKDPEEIEIDQLEFDADGPADAAAEAPADEDEEIELETFSFDSDAASSVTQENEEAAETVTTSDEDDPNAVEFSFDKEELEEDAETLEPASNEEVETFDFDLEEDSGDTVLEKPDTEINVASEDEVEDFDFDLDEFEIEPATEESSASNDEADEDFLDLDAEDEQEQTPEVAVEDVSIDDDEIEFDIDAEDEPAANDAGGDESEDDLEFLSDDDVEIESVDESEDVNMLSDDDETATKLELAYAYQKMGDAEGAKEILQEVIKEGSDEQIEEANKLLGSLDGKSD